MNTAFSIKLPPRQARNNVARDMILSGQGRKQVFQDRRNKRSKDHRRKREQFDE